MKFLNNGDLMEASEAFKVFYENHGGDKEEILHAIYMLGLTHFKLGDLVTSRDWYEKGIETVKEYGGNFTDAKFIHEISLIEMKLGNFKESRNFAYQSLSKFLENPMREIKSGFTSYVDYDLDGICPGLTVIAQTYIFEKDFDTAIELLRASEELCRTNYSIGSLSKVHNELGLAYVYSGRVMEGIIHLKSSVDCKNKIGDRMGALNTLNNIQSIISSLGNSQAADE